jgi:hypothetical protein
MKQVTINIPDKLYISFLELFKHIPDITIAEEKEFSITEKQKKTLDYRRKTSTPQDFIPWNEAKKQLKYKSKK